MKKTFKILIFIFIITSCVDKQEGEEKPTFLSNFISISDNENKGINSILEFYAGRCDYSIGASTTSQSGRKKFFKIEISESATVEKLINKIHLPSSNIAYLFFKNLKEERKKYDEIHVVIKSKDDYEKEFKFPISVLQRVEKRMSLLEKTKNLIKKKQYESLNSMMNNELISFNKDELVPKLKEIEPKLGEIKEFLFFGFMVVPFKGTEILHMSGVMKREKQNTEFSIDIDFNSDENILYQLQYKL